jgi:type IV secretory pathway TraG/TraD family ATPase VirD4
MKIANYVRGQELFFSRVFLFFANLKRLVFVSFSASLISYLIYFFIFIPSSFFTHQMRIFSLLKKLSFFEISSFETLSKSIFSLTYENFSIYSETLSSITFLSLITGVLCLFFMVIFFHFKGKFLIKKHIKRGSELISSRQFKKAIIKSMKKSNFEEGFSFAEDESIKLPEKFLTRHLAISGQTGTGKSTILRRFVSYVRKKKQKAIIIDINGELSKLFKQENDVVLSLFDKRSRKWNFSCEKGITPATFASFLVPEQGDKNAFWWKGARSIVESLLETEQDPSKLYDLIQDKDKIKESLSGFSRAILGDKADSQADGLIASAILDMNFLKYLSNHNQTELFSLTDWVSDEKANIVWLTVQDHNMSLVKPILSLWVNIVILELLKRDPEKDNMPINIIIDELASFNSFELLPKGLERLRKYDGRIILSYQSDSQLDDVYGHKKAISIRSNTGSKIIFRSPEPSDSKYLSAYLGSGEIDQVLTSQSIGIKSTSDRENISENEKYKPAVLESEIQSLKDYHFFLKTLSFNPTYGKIKDYKIDPVDIDRNNYFFEENNLQDKKQNEESIDLDFTKIVDDFSE